MIQNTATKRFVAVPGYSRLFRRGAIYYFRVGVPQVLRGAIGKTEIIKSLRTTNCEEAKRLVALESVATDSLFESLRRKIRGIPTQIRQDDMSEEEVRQFVLEWFILAERASEKWWQNEGRFLNAEERHEGLLNIATEFTALTAPNESGPYRPTNADFQLDRFLNEKGIRFEKNSAAYQQLSAAFHQGAIAHAQRRMARIQFEPPPADVPLFQNVHSHTPLPSRVRSTTLGQLLDRYLAYIEAGRSETTLSTYRTPVRVMREVIGNATRLSDITRETIGQFFELLKKRPRNAAQRYPGLTTEQAISASNIRRDEKKLSEKSLQNYYTNVLAVFNFAVDEKLIAENPAKYRSLREQFRKRQRTRKPLFTSEQLSQIFLSPPFDRSFHTSHLDTEPFPCGRFFVTLLALFQGFRCNEACQIYTEDVRVEQGIPLIAIRGDREDGSESEKRIKGDPSDRIVPVHSTVLRIGFMDFVEQRRRDKTSPRLFPDLPLGKSRRYSNPFSKWFSRFLTSTFEEKPRATFHSFRHHFRDALGEKRVGIDAVDRLGGWRSRRSHEREYGEGLSFPVLREELNKIEYPGLNLNHLFR